MKNLSFHLLCTVLLLAAGLLFSSHELFLKADKYHLETRSLAELFLLNGDFDKSENTITRDRIVHDTLVGPGPRLSPVDSDYYDRGAVTRLKFWTGEEGSCVAGISTLPKMIDLSANEFLEYLEHEGLVDMIIERAHKGLSGSAAREKYSKHVKAILQVGDAPSDHFSARLDYPIEFIALDNPYAHELGDTLRFQLLFRGKPLSGEVVRFGSRPDAGHEAGKAMSGRTDEEGMFLLPVDRAGIWYLATIHMEESPEEGVDYESNWATITFEIP
jgi:hypothetical protein